MLRVDMEGEHTTIAFEESKGEREYYTLHSRRSFYGYIKCLNSESPAAGHSMCIFLCDNIDLIH